MNTTRTWFRARGRLVSLAVLAAKAAVTVDVVGASSSTDLQSATQGCLCTEPVRSSGSNLKLNLVIYNHAHVKEETLLAAESTMSAIFARAGVRLVWRDGFSYAAARRKFEIPPPEDPATLVVKLQPDSEATRYGVRSVCGGIGFDSGAIIFVRRHNATWLGVIIAQACLAAERDGCSSGRARRPYRFSTALQLRTTVKGLLLSSTGSVMMNRPASPVTEYCFTLLSMST